MRDEQSESEPTRNRSGKLRRDRVLAALLGLGVVGVVLQITLGGIVRVTNSGEGCGPDWPKCDGSWIPPLEYHALFEWSHRATGVLVGVAIVLTVLWALWKHRDRPPLAWMIGFSLFLIAVVGGIGGSVVLADLNPALRTLHLGLAELVPLGLAAALVFAQTQEIAPGARATHLRGPGFLVLLGAIMVLLTLLSGSYAVWRGAGAVCSGWPLCGGGVFPNFELGWIQLVHRILAGVSAVVAIWGAIWILRLRPIPASLRTAAWTILAITVAQIFVGAANPWSHFADWSEAAHLSLATLMWMALAWTAMLVWPPSTWPFWRRPTASRSIPFEPGRPPSASGASPRL